MENQEKKSSKLALVVKIVIAVAFLVVLFIYIIFPTIQYVRASVLKNRGDFAKAASVFSSLDNFLDAPKKLQLCNYNEAERLENEECYTAAAMMYGALDDYKDSKDKSFALWNEIVPRTTFVYDGKRSIALKNDGSVITFYENNYSIKELDDVVEVAAGRLVSFALKSDGTVWKCGDETCEPLEDWTNIVSISAASDFTDGESLVGLRSDGTVIYKAAMFRDEDDEYGQGNVTGWRNIISVKCSDSLTAGLMANGTVNVTGYISDEAKAEVNSWTDIVAIEVGEFHVLGLKSDGTVVCAGNSREKYSNVDSWANVIMLSAETKCSMGLTSDGKVLHSGAKGHEQCLSWGNIVAIHSDFSGPFGIKADGSIICITDDFANKELRQKTETWTNICSPKIYAYYKLDNRFTNKYGEPDTICAHEKCETYIASSGDTNCCETHSNRCGNCGFYIDEDAMFCMDCIKGKIN